MPRLNIFSEGHKVYFKIGRKLEALGIIEFFMFLQKHKMIIERIIIRQ